MASTGEVWKLGHRPALDGVRGVAVAAVVLSHTSVLPASGGPGVNTFFALSGFLITSLLLEERARAGAVNLRAFYRRRALRLLPALAATVAVVVLAGWALGLGASWVTAGAALASLLYVSNFATAAGLHSTLSHTWSLSVEEQFYLTWPLVLLAAARWGGRRFLLTVALTGAVSSAGWRAWLTSAGAQNHADWSIDTRIAPILLGCALAAFLHGSTDRHSRPGVAVLAGMVLAARSVTGFGGPWGSAVDGLAAVVILWALTGREGCRPLSGRAVQWLGVRSYGIYLWHAPITVLIGESAAPGLSGLVLFAAVAPLTLVVAAASYRWIEEPFLRLKGETAATRPIPRSGTSIAPVPR